MTPTATAEHDSSRAAPAAARTLSDAVRAVNDHRREMELRRMAHAARQSQATSTWMVPVPHARLQALEQQAREAARLRRVLDSVLVRLPQTSDAQPPPSAERHLSSTRKPRPRLDARQTPAT